MIAFELREEISNRANASAKDARVALPFLSADATAPVLWDWLRACDPNGEHGSEKLDDAWVTIAELVGAEVGFLDELATRVGAGDAEVVLRIRTKRGWMHRVHRVRARDVLSEAKRLVERSENVRAAFVEPFAFKQGGKYMLAPRGRNWTWGRNRAERAEGGAS